MSRYIDADALTDHMLERYNELCEKHGDYDHYTTGYGDAIDVIENAPTADVVEVRHGEWIKSSPYNRFMNCSVCGFGQNHTSFPYCPMCGAKIIGIREKNDA